MFGFLKPTNPDPAKSDTVTDPAEANDQVGEIMPSGGQLIVPGSPAGKRRSSVATIGN